MVPAKVTRSIAGIPSSHAASSFPAPMPSIKPTPEPRPTSAMPCRRTMPMTSAERAPSAMRMPISSPRPETVAEHDNRAGARLLAVAGIEQSPGRWRDAEHGEVVGGDDVAEDALGADTLARLRHAHRL